MVKIIGHVSKEMLALSRLSFLNIVTWSCLQVGSRSPNLFAQRGFVNDIQHAQHFTQRATTVPNKQGHVSAQMLILIGLPHKHLHPLHTPAIHPKYLRNTYVPKQIHFTLNTPPLRRTGGPHMETQWVCFYGGTGCGVGWRVRVTPACPSRFIFGQRRGKRSSAWCNVTIFHRVNGRCLFSLLLMEWSGGEKWSLKKGGTYDDQVFFPSSWECFTL